MCRVLVVGIDSLDPIYLQEWVDEGILPTFKRLIEEGIFGKLRSVVPPITVPAWPSVFTGKSPQQLEAFDFLNPEKDKNGYALRPVNSARWNDSLIWNILGQAGKKSGVINAPGILAHRINGYIIGGFPLSWLAGNFYPDYLENDIKSNVKNAQKLFEVHKTPFKSIPKIRRITEIEVDLGLYLRKKFDFDFLIQVFGLLDFTLHNTNKEEVLKQSYVKMDAELERYLDNTSEYDIFIVSDHGAKKVKRNFNLLKWLSDQGYVCRIRNTQNPSYFVMKIISYLGSLRHLEGILRIAGKYATNLLQLQVFGRSRLQSFMDEIDWRKTIAFPAPILCCSYGGIYLTTKANHFVKELSKSLREIKDPLTGKTIVRKIHTLHSNKTPLLLVEFDKDYVVLSDPKPNLFLNTDRFVHNINGTLIAHGPNIRKNKKINNAELIDLAPTILHFMKVVIPKDVHGKILRNIFIKGSLQRSIQHQKREVSKVEEEFRFSQDEEDIIKKRLKSLGYF